MVAHGVAQQNAIFLLDMRIVVLLVGAAMSVLKTMLADEHPKMSIDESGTVVRKSRLDRVWPLLNDAAKCIESDSLSATEYGPAPTLSPVNTATTERA